MVRKWSTLLMFVVLLLGTSGLAWGVTRASGRIGGGQVALAPRPPAPAASPSRATSPAAPVAEPRASEPPTPVEPASTPSPTPGARDTTSATPEPTRSPDRQHPRQLRPGPRLLGPGDDGAGVRKLQARLRQIAWFSGDVTDHYGPVTQTAVRGFQAKRGIPVTGYVDQRTLDRLLAMTHEPTAAELANRLPTGPSTDAPLDPRCTTGRALCIDKTSRTLRWVVDGKVHKTMDVRFGASYSPTREGLFQVEWKSADWVSTLYGSAMPYSMFFSGGQAVHYSSDFAARGYYGASHGCVNVRDYDGIRWLFGQVHVGDKVVVYWS
ncbi:MAG TPA: peptidoglycan-binding protein [Marmoricola sp.]|nr:peptidoglycan-binding protein [Marmoricola sp.]